jgi:rRNA maturation endonuclease Nob1
MPTKKNRKLVAIPWEKQSFSEARKKSRRFLAVCWKCGARLVDEFECPSCGMQLEPKGSSARGNSKGVSSVELEHNNKYEEEIV